MDTLSLVTFFLAISTFLLAVAAFWTIWQNYCFKKEEKDFRLKTAALDNIHQWLMDILQTTSFYLSAVREENEKSKFIASSQCLSVSTRGADMLVAAGIFGLGFVDKIEQVNNACDEYHQALSEVQSGQTVINNQIVENYSKALCEALITLGKKKMELLPEYFKKKVEVGKAKEKN